MSDAGEGRADQPCGEPSAAVLEFARATIAYAVRHDAADLDEAEERLGRLHAARTTADVYAAIAGLPHPPAPLHLGSNDKEKRRWKR